MSKNDGMVPDDVFERLKQRIEDMKAECISAIDRVSRSLPQHIHEHLEYANRCNNDLMQLGRLVDWQNALRQARREQEEQVLQ